MVPPQGPEGASMARNAARNVKYSGHEAIASLPYFPKSWRCKRKSQLVTSMIRFNLYGFTAKCDEQHRPLAVIFSAEQLH